MEKVWKFISGSFVRTASLPRAEDKCRRMSPTQRLAIHHRTCD